MKTRQISKRKGQLLSQGCLISVYIPLFVHNLKCGTADVACPNIWYFTKITFRVNLRSCGQRLSRFHVGCRSERAVRSETCS